MLLAEATQNQHVESTTKLLAEATQSEVAAHNDEKVNISEDDGREDELVINTTELPEFETDHHATPEKEARPRKSIEHKPEAVCRYFRRGNCKHGLRGSECRYSHPQMCKKFLKHGTRQPNGCNLGKRCKQFHPLMCMDSLKKSECLNEKCTFNHIKGTRRQHKLFKNNQQNMPISSSPTPAEKPAVEKTTKDDNQADHFLDVVRLLKAEIISTMNAQIASLATQIQGIQQVQAQQFPSLQMPYYQPAIIPPSQSQMNQQLLFTPQILQGTQQRTTNQMQTPTANRMQTPATSNQIQTQTTNRMQTPVRH